jgi:Ca2+-binding RTX toxin-like protein
MSEKISGTAGSFINSLGVQTHLPYTDSQYANWQNVLADLQYLGISNVRDRVQNIYTGGGGGKHYDPLADAGIKFDFVVSRESDPNFTIQRIRDFVTKHPGSLTMMEGPNEIDSWPVSFDGQTGLAGAVAYQTWLYNTLKADPLLKDIPLANLSFSTGWSGYTYRIGDMSGVVDYGNAHTYFNNGDQPGSLVGPLKNVQSYVTPGKDMVISEAGYHTAVNSTSWQGVDEPTQAKLTLNLVFDAFKAGVKQTYLYQLMDGYADPTNSQQEKHFGLFDINNRPKDVAVALHNLTSILGHAPGASLGDAVDATVGQLPAKGASLLLDKGYGVRDLVIWAEPDIWDQANRKPMTVPAQNVTVTFGSIVSSVQLYDPLVGDTAIKSWSNVSSIDVAISDHPVIIEYGGAVTARFLTGTTAADKMTDAGTCATLCGGTGDDVYTLTVAQSHVDEKAGGGTDTVMTAFSHALDANVEKLILTGTAAIDGTGNDLDNTLTGNAAANTLDGGAGADLMIGGVGDDTYLVRDAGDRVVEKTGGGTDTIQSWISYAAPDNVERLILMGTADINAVGNKLTNHLVGNDGANRLDGSAGADLMEGGAGNDTYVVDNALDKVVEHAGQGHDTVYSSVSYTLSNDVEDLYLTGRALKGEGNGLDNILVGNVADNVLDGKAGADVMSGGLGNDTYIVDSAGDVVTERPGEGIDQVRSSVTHHLSANVEWLYLTGDDAIDGYGNDLDNKLVGNAAANLLDGGAGADRMAGGIGDDTYMVDNSGDVVVESAGQGRDVIYSSVSYALPENVEELRLLGSGNLSATGNRMDNVLVGNEGSNILSGGRGCDTIVGGRGNDTLSGGSEADVFVFGAHDGKDVITDFTVRGSAHDVIRFTEGPASLSEVMACAQTSGKDVLISLTPEDSILLRNVMLSSLTADNFAFG